MSLSRRVLRLLLSKQADMPEAVRAQARLHIADSVGIATAARHSSTFANDIVYGMGLGGATGGCRVIGGPEQLPPAAAAFANAALMHILDFDDIHDAARVHPTPVTLGAALAASDMSCGDGRTLVESVVLGNELTLRLAGIWKPSGDGPGSNWFLTQLCGYFGACLAAGLVLDLSEDELVSALGIAYMQCSGGKEAALGVGSNARAVYPGFGAAGGIQAALLASSGVTGPASALDGSAGLFTIYFGREPDSEQLAMLLDPEPWFFRDTQIKPWPTCRLSHPYIAAAREVRCAVPEGAAIERVVLAVNESAAKLCRPLDERRVPRTLQDAKYSLPFVTAVALVHEEISLRTINDDILTDKTVLDIAARTDIEHRLPDGIGHPPAEIAVHTDSGVFSSTPGPRDFALSEAEVRRKFEASIAMTGLAVDAAGAWDRLLNVDETGSSAAFLKTTGCVPTPS
jgi:2-methylcitrate dehydratase PrpD